MNREQLIRQVKDEYARLTDLESRQGVTNAVIDVTPEAYYESLLGQVLDAISAGKFDDFSSGRAIVEASQMSIKDACMMYRTISDLGGKKCGCNQFLFKSALLGGDYGALLRTFLAYRKNPVALKKTA